MKKAIPLSIIALYFILFISAIPNIKEIKINARNELFYDKESRDYKNLVYFKEKYNIGNEILIALTGKEIFSKEGFGFISKLSNWLKDQKIVLRVTDITTINDPFIFMVMHVNTMNEVIKKEKFIKIFKHNIMHDNLYRGALISKDGKVTGVVVELKPGYMESDILELLDNIRRNFGDKGFELHFSGFPLNSISFAGYINRDQRIFSPLIFILFSIILFIIYGNLRGVIYPLVIILVSLAITLSIFVYTGHRLTPLTSLLIPIVLTISISDSIHIINRYIKLRRNEIDSPILLTLKQMFKPCLMTSLTTSLGFASLIIFKTPAIVEFGKFAAIGSLIAFIVSISLLFPLLSLFGFPERNLNPTFKEELIQKLPLFIYNKRKEIFTGVIITFLFSLIFVMKIEVNTDYISYLRKKDELYRSNLFIDRKLTGINSIDMLLRYKNRNLLEDPELFNRLLLFEKLLRAQKEVTNVISPADFYLKILKTKHIVPGSVTKKELKKCREITKLYMDDAFSLYHKDINELRINVRFKALKSKETVKFIERIKSISSSVFPKHIEVIPVGEVILFNKIAEKLVHHQTESIILALLTIIITVGLFFKSFKILFASILPNTLPVIFAYSTMGIFHIELNLPTAMVASAALGLIVDDTIHFIYEYKSAREEGSSPIRAVENTFKKAGFSALCTSLILITGISIGMLSNFEPTFYFSLILCISVGIAFICDLLVTPSMLMSLRI
jgi:hypothetical protein